MATFDRTQHWGNVYTTKDEAEVSWFQTVPQVSLDLIARTGLGHEAAVIDIGGGASRLVDHLLADGYRSISVLDIAESALTKSRARLGGAAKWVEWLVTDITTWSASRTYDIWHDRAVFHFLTDPADRQAYRTALLRGTQPGSQVIIGTFALSGPEKCSGLPVRRYDATALASELGGEFLPLESISDDHRTPGGNIQHFQYSRFERR